MVRGTASVCTNVTVSISDLSNGNLITVGAGVTNGEWEARFVAGSQGVGTALKGYNCDETCVVRASCSSDDECSNTATLSLSCVSPCTQFADVRVTNAETTEKFDNPPLLPMPLPAGDHNRSNKIHRIRK